MAEIARTQKEYDDPKSPFYTGRDGEPTPSPSPTPTTGGPPDYAKQLASGMESYQTAPANKISDPRTRMEWLRESAKGMEGNPFVSRMLQNLMFAEIARGDEEKLYQRGRKDTLADAATKRKQAIEDRKFGKRPTRTKQSATPGMVYDETWNPETGTWDRGPDYDPNLVSETALAQKTTVKRAGEGRGPFSGKSRQGQTMNILLSPNPDTSSRLYHAAYAELAQPKIYTDPTTQEQRLITPDMRAYPKPTDLNPASTWNPIGTQEDIGTGRGKWEPIDYSQHGGIPGRERPVGTPTISAQEGPVGRTKEYNEFQSKSGGFYNRMLDANKTLDDLFAGPDAVTGTADDLKKKDVYSNWQFMMDAIPGVGNLMVSDNFQKARQGMRNWVTANLRLESGAAIPPLEQEQEFKKWFPVFGDGEAVIEQKKESRKIVEENMRIQSQGAWESKFKPMWDERLKTREQQTGDMPLDKPLGEGAFKMLPDGRIVRKERRGR